MMGLQIAYVIQFLGLAATVAFVGALAISVAREVTQRQVREESIPGPAPVQGVVTGSAL